MMAQTTKNQYVLPAFFLETEESDGAVISGGFLAEKFSNATNIRNTFSERGINEQSNHIQFAVWRQNIRFWQTSIKVFP